jgi:Ser/Thr protein kinase RdoA (MazF antagonist)
MSLNVGLTPAGSHAAGPHATGLVLRVHRPLISRARLVALQAVREGLAGQGLGVPAPVPWQGATLFRCGERWAELEPFLPGVRPEATPDAYAWMFRAMGALHRALAPLDLHVPRPVVATYGPPSTLRRWLQEAEGAVRGDEQAAYTARRLRGLVGRLRALWVPAPALPVHLIHGDIRLGNVCLSPGGAPPGEPVYFDFGFLARRPRVHELAYALSWIVLRPDSRGSAEGFAWELVPRLVGEYEGAARTSLTAAERRALAPYTAAVPLYLGAIAAQVPDPVAHLRHETRLRFLDIAEWLLAHPEAVFGSSVGPSL